MDLGSTLSPLQAQVREGMEYVFTRAGLTGDRALRITKKKEKKGEILIVKTLTHVKSIETKQKKKIRIFPASSFSAFFDRSSIETCARKNVCLNPFGQMWTVYSDKKLAYAACLSEII